MQNGFAIIEGNNLEALAGAALAWCEEDPLEPLEQETFLVQTTGMADWLKLQQASRAPGVSASACFPLPATFLGQMYRRVLAPDEPVHASPFDRASLKWRLWKLLPRAMSLPGFARVRHFLKDEEDAGDGLDNARRYQLSEALADLYEQYQLYRGDWLRTWESGQKLPQGLGPDEAWQAELWRQLVDDMPLAARDHSRAQLHQRFIDTLGRCAPGTLVGVPRRMVLFGINSLPAALLESLYALARHSQVLMFVLNPCREFWDDRDGGIGHPLLGAWGARGRDFMRLLHGYAPSLELQRRVETTGAFADPRRGETDASVLHALQQSLLDRVAPSGGPSTTLAPLPEVSRAGVDFYPSYSRQREIEVLHDRLLELFASQPDLTYRDVVVMAPDIEHYVPHVHAVFDRHADRDPRHLAYSISDRAQTADSALYQVLVWLLDLPRARVTRSEVLALLELPAVQQRFALPADDRDAIRQWIDATWTRWGLDAEHKSEVLDLTTGPSDEDVATEVDLRLNTWQAGLDQLLAGYCAGDAAIWEGTAWVDDVAAGQAGLLGHLCLLIDALRSWRHRLQASRTPEAWQRVFHQLLDAFFVASSDAEREVVGALRAALHEWTAHCRSADFGDELPARQAAQGWLDQVASAAEGQGIHFSGINFCTMLPMRALPFRHVFLLGMNDGDYPRARIPLDFDLLQCDPRVGDRDRRQEDRYLFLEALLSARDGLHISWIGHDIRNGTDRMPSVLVQQLQAYIDRYWASPGAPVERAGQLPTLSEALTLDYPLTAFSRTYFEQATAGRARPITHEYEWRMLYADVPGGPAPVPVDMPLPEPLPATSLATLLRQPVAVYFGDRLRTRFEKGAGEVSDDEAFALNDLEQWQLRDRLLHAQLMGRVDEEARIRVSGALPIGAAGASGLDDAMQEANSVYERCEVAELDARPPCALRVALRVDNAPCTVEGETANLYARRGESAPGWMLVATAGKLKEATKYRLEKLAHAWVSHLLANACGLRVVTAVVGLDTRVVFRVLDEVDARRNLEQLVSVYVRALAAPLPITREAATAWLQTAADGKTGSELRDAAQKAFGLTKSFRGATGDCKDATVLRAFPDFDSVWRGDGAGFRQFAESLYKPLLGAVEASQGAQDGAR